MEHSLLDEFRTANSSVSSFKRLCTIFYKDKVFDPGAPIPPGLVDS